MLGALPALPAARQRRQRAITWRRGGADRLGRGAALRRRLRARRALVSDRPGRGDGAGADRAAAVAGRASGCWSASVVVAVAAVGDDLQHRVGEHDRAGGDRRRRRRRASTRWSPRSARRWARASASCCRSRRRATRSSTAPGYIPLAQDDPLRASCSTSPASWSSSRWCAFCRRWFADRLGPLPAFLP